MLKTIISFIILAALIFMILTLVWFLLEWKKLSPIGKIHISWIITETGLTPKWDFEFYSGTTIESIKGIDKLYFDVVEDTNPLDIDSEALLEAWKKKGDAT